MHWLAVFGYQITDALILALFSTSVLTLNGVTTLTFLLMFFVSAQAFHLYQSLRSLSPIDYGSTVLKVGLVSAIALALIMTGWQSKTFHFMDWLSLLLAFSALWCWRILVQWTLGRMRRQGRDLKKVILIASDERLAEIQHYLDRHEELGFAIQAQFSPEDMALVLDYLKSEAVDFIWIAPRTRYLGQLPEITQQLADFPARIRLIPDAQAEPWFNSKHSTLDGLSLWAIQDSPLNEDTASFKRVMDLLGSMCFIAIFALPMILIAAWIRFDSAGPVFFKQTRTGLSGREFTVWKFRTMRQDAGVEQASQNDDRITRSGAWLRKTSLDELPQLFNVLIGEMSLVGPRPHAVEHHAMFLEHSPSYLSRHVVKPGMTGWAQIHGWRGETDTEEKIIKRVEHDLYYIQHWSVRLDFKILWLTLFRGFIHKNAY